MGPYREKKGTESHILRALFVSALLPVMAASASWPGNLGQVQAAGVVSQIAVKAPAQAVEKFQICASSVDTVTLTWAEASDAETYYISYWESGRPSTSVSIDDIGDVQEYKITNLRQAKYIFQIQPANKLHTGIPLKGKIAAIEGAPSPAQPSGITANHVKAGYSSFIIKGLGDIYQTEAEVYDASGSLLETFEGNFSGAAAEDAGIKDNGFYAVRVRGYYGQEGGYRSYGDWTGLHYFATPFKPIRLSQKNGKVTVKWPEVDGARSYTVWMSQSASGGFKKAAVTKNTKLSIAKFAGVKLKPGKAYYVKVAAGMERDGETYTASGAVSKIKMK